MRQKSKVLCVLRMQHEGKEKHYIKGCPCLFKVAWIADHALKNIYVIQKCASCGYTKEQCDYVFEELKSMKIVDTNTD